MNAEMRNWYFVYCEKLKKFTCQEVIFFGSKRKSLWI